MLSIALCLLVSFFVAFSLTPQIIRLAHQHGIFDHFNERKVHVKKVPRFGGGAIVVGVLAATAAGSHYAGLATPWPLLVATLVVAAVGVVDDYESINHRYKLVPEILAALAVAYFADLRLTSLHGLFGVGDIPTWLGYALTVFTVIVVANAFNLIDGIDGLAGTLAVLIFGAYGTWFFWVGHLGAGLLCFSAVGASAAFLTFNFRTKIFMGDTGSLALGFLAAFVTIGFLQANAILPEASPAKMASPVLFACCMLALPLFDTIRVFVLRMASGRSPFSADKNHLHHLLLALHLRHYQATLVLVGTNAAFLATALLAQGLDLDTTLGLALGLGLAATLSTLLKKQVDSQPTLPQLLQRRRQRAHHTADPATKAAGRPGVGY
jgi:UDP-N-acetylmuramyl pentapeptide phosphotransferase/UDP-N-acetylglucosamine-1-phosphate transferase